MKLKRLFLVVMVSIILLLSTTVFASDNKRIFIIVEKKPIIISSLDAFQIEKEVTVMNIDRKSSSNIMLDIPDIYMGSSIERVDATSEKGIYTLELSPTEKLVVIILSEENQRIWIKPVCK